MKWYDAWGADQTYPHMAVAWSWAFDMLFKWTKQIPSFFGGTKQGMAISWPACSTPIADFSSMRSALGRRWRRERWEWDVSICAAFVDANGNPFDRSKTYKLRLPGPVPVKNFWLVILYDNQTRSTLQTNQPWPSVSSQTKRAPINLATLAETPENTGTEENRAG